MTQNQHAHMWKPHTNNQALPCGVSPMEGHQKEIQHLEQYKNATRKGLWSEKNNEVSQDNRNTWWNINIMNSW